MKHGMVEATYPSDENVRKYYSWRASITMPEPALKSSITQKRLNWLILKKAAMCWMLPAGQEGQLQVLRKL